MIITGLPGRGRWPNQVFLSDSQLTLYAENSHPGYPEVRVMKVHHGS